MAILKYGPKLYDIPSNQEVELYLSPMDLGQFVTILTNRMLWVCVYKYKYNTFIIYVYI